MDRLERMLAEQDCRRLVHLAAEYVDLQRAAALAELFTVDGVLVRPGAEPLRGREAIQGAYAQRPPERMTRHLVAQTVIHFEGTQAARGRSLVQLWSGSAGDADGAQGRPAHARVLLGEFDDHFVLTAEGWRIERRDARFVFHGEIGPARP